MDWITLSISGYLLLAIESVASKILLGSKVKSWQLFVFYVGILAFASVLLVPFGVVWPGSRIVGLSIFSGVLLFIYVFFLLKALNCASASRVFVLIGAVNTIATMFFARYLELDFFTSRDLLGVLALCLGGFFISFKFERHGLFVGFFEILLAGVFLAASTVVLKYVFSYQNFLSGYVYSRAGMWLVAFSLMLYPAFRAKIKTELARNEKKDSMIGFVAVIFVNAMAGVANIMITRGISLGSVTIVSALISVQYLFTFVLSILLALKYKNLLKENLCPKTIILKTLGVSLIVFGVILVTLNK